MHFLSLSLLPFQLASWRWKLPDLMKRELDKPVITPEFYAERLESALAEEFESPEYEIDVWTSNEIPETCAYYIHMEQIDGKNLTTTDVEVFTVKYEDCEDSWTMCRHPSNNGTNDDMATNFGKLPPNVRTIHQHILATGETDQYKLGAGAYSNGAGTIMVMAEYIRKFSVYGHESGHSLDPQVFANGTLFSNSTDWLEAFDDDESVVTRYAQTTQVENFAEMVNVALYDINVDGGISEISSDWEEFRNQLNAIRDNDFLMEALDRSTTCGEKTREDSGNVDKDAPDAVVEPSSTASPPPAETSNTGGSDAPEQSEAPTPDSGAITIHGTFSFQAVAAILLGVAALI